MNWRIKAGLQQVLSAMPLGENINYLLQRYVTRSLPATMIELRGKVKAGQTHYQNSLNYITAQKPPKFFEFGAGWDLAIPLTYYSLGADNQTVTDLRPLLRFSLLNNTISKLKEIYNDKELLVKRIFRPFPFDKIKDKEQLKSAYGINYQAPVDARSTGFADNHFTFISATVVLEAIPAEILPSIMTECYRILTTGGVCSLFIVMNDLYAGFDRNAGHYNFLKYSSVEWSKYNSPLHYQNRLRYPDYRALFLKAGFEIVDEKISWPDKKDMEILNNMKLADEFRTNYKIEELGVKSLWIVLRKS